MKHRGKLVSAQKKIGESNYFQLRRRVVSVCKEEKDCSFLVQRRGGGRSS